MKHDEYSKSKGRYCGSEPGLFSRVAFLNRRRALVEAYQKKYDGEDIYECPVCIVESEIHMVQALEDVKKAGCNALVVYLGNFVPEILRDFAGKAF